MGGLAACLGACHPTAQQHGSTRITAAYRLPTLRATLPESARVPAVITAAEQTVRTRGYSVESVEVTEEAGKLVVRPPRTNDLPKIVIQSHVEARATRVTLTVWPVGDEELARSVLDGTLQRLGL
ncbi:MAG: hypothetical protein HBSAPP03_18070 [Phycisphaerae bacterium]|nr:MAG: hypothetical protein HBSAPP03_18070 [Phycisphaerae bacterium]